MSGQFLWGRFLLVTTAIMVSGWGIMRYSTPTDEQFYQDASKTDQIVWAEQLGSTKPTGRGRRV
ncbi:hypothetical protein M231_05934 [Tremella mesenterica]|uniref:Uncharacterized protein n=1 Tax=Tremella mesenterica TaxID=5217 RepID=A0A4Q1BGR6_TREME|nr:hypothetical protein M231_05934 [Tremella mesenterica]